MNLKTIILASFLTIGFGLAQAQETQSYMAINLGVSLPQGDYGETNINNPSSGFAKPGPELSIEGVYYIIDYIGIGGKSGFNYHNFDKIAFRNEYVSKTGADEVYFSSASPYVNVHTCAGLYLNVPVTEKFHISPKALAGVMTTFKAQIDARVDYSNQSDLYFYDDFETALDFAYLLGLDLRYIVTDHFMLKLNFERLASKHTFNDNYLVEYDYNMLSFSLSAGIAF